MAPHSPKRRKLDHESDLSELPDEDQSRTKIEEEATPNSTPKITASSRTEHKTIASQARINPLDSTAIYDGNSYKSSLFKLQVEEMLAEMRPNYKKRFSPVVDALHKLKVSIESIADKEPVTVSVKPHLLMPKLIRIDFRRNKAHAKVESCHTVPRPKTRP